jgi:diacylglycerol kinase
MRLIEAERGFSFGFRNGSTLYGQIFTGLIIIVTAAVLGIRFEQWIALIVAMAGGLAAELFHLSICAVSQSLEGEAPKKASKLSAAGMLMAMISSLTVIFYVLGSRLTEILE